MGDRDLLNIFWIGAIRAHCYLPQSILTLCFGHQRLISKWISHSELNMKKKLDLVTEKEEANEKMEGERKKKIKYMKLCA